MSATEAAVTHEPKLGTFKLQPLYDRILLQRCKHRMDKTAGGVFIPETHREPPMEAIVIAVGAGRVNEQGKIVQLEVKVGQKILMGKYAGTDIEVDEVEYVMLREEEVLAIVHDNS